LTQNSLGKFLESNFKINGNSDFCLGFSSADISSKLSKKDEAKILKQYGGGSQEGGSAETDNFKFSTNYLNGKTLYNVYEECKTYDNQGKCTETKPKWEMTVLTFTDTTLSGYSYTDPSEKVENIPYTITSKGYVKFVAPEDKKTEYIKPLEITTNYIRLDWTNQEEGLNTDRYLEYFYFDETKGKALLDAKNN